MGHFVGNEMYCLRISVNINKDCIISSNSKIDCCSSKVIRDCSFTVISRNSYLDWEQCYGWQLLAGCDIEQRNFSEDASKNFLKTGYFRFVVTKIELSSTSQP